MQYVADSFNMNEYRKPEMTLERAKEQMKNLLDIQLSDGNWNANEYMYGMANAMILAYAILNDVTPIYLDKPDYFLNDKTEGTLRLLPIRKLNVAAISNDGVTKAEWKDYGNDTHGGPCQCAICKTPKITNSVVVSKNGGWVYMYRQDMKNNSDKEVPVFNNTVAAIGNDKWELGGFDETGIVWIEKTS